MELACVRRGDAWRSQCRVVLGNPRSTALLAIGATLLVVGIVADRGEPVFLGPAVAVLGVLLPVASQVKAGKESIELSVREDDADRTFAAFVTSRRRALTRVAVRLCDGDRKQARDDVTAALAKAGVRWDGNRLAADMYALCLLAWRTLARVAERRDPAALAAARTSVLVALRNEEQLEWRQLAEMFRAPVDEVRQDALDNGALA